MYRDGVGEGQFKLVLAHEMKAMREACLELERDGSYNPGITFVCVQVSFDLFRSFFNDLETSSHAPLLRGPQRHGWQEQQHPGWYRCRHQDLPPIPV